MLLHLAETMLLRKLLLKLRLLRLTAPAVLQIAVLLALIQAAALLLIALLLNKLGKTQLCPYSGAGKLRYLEVTQDAAFFVLYL